MRFSSPIIVPAIGKVSVQNLSGSQVQAIYAGMLERGLSHTTILHVHRVLKQMLACAVKWGVIVKNPADAATPPKREKKQMPMWDAATIREFIEESQGTRYARIYEFAVMTGLRRSEICGLKWDAVDLESGRLEVVATLQQIRGQGLVTGAPKTTKSRRNITRGHRPSNCCRWCKEPNNWPRLKRGHCGRSKATCSPRPTGRRCYLAPSPKTLRT